MADGLRRDAVSPGFRPGACLDASGFDRCHERNIRKRGDGEYGSPPRLAIATPQEPAAHLPGARDLGFLAGV